MKFIRKNGRIIPIHDVQEHNLGSVRTGTAKQTAGQRFKTGATLGGVVGAVGGLAAGVATRSPVAAAGWTLGGAAIHGLGLGALNAAIGSRKVKVAAYKSGKK